MPQLITHNIFAKEVYNSLNIKIDSINIAVYEMYAQSFDNFIYYISPNINKMNKIHKFSKRGHKTRVKKYFMNMIKNIIDMHLENDPDALAYLFGSIDHYVLDSTCHPLIFYKTGVFSPKDRKGTKKYLGLHTDMETHIDAFYYINRYKKSFHKVKTAKEFIPKIKFSKTLENLMNKTFEDTFKEKDAAKYYFKAYKNSRWMYPLFINDKYGIKKIAYKLVDKIYYHRNTNYEYISTYIKQPKINYLNIEHKKWVYPSDKKIKMNDSFIDLYDKSLVRAKELIETAYKVLNKKAKLKEFEDIIGNLSYVRGLDCDNSTYMKYFEF